MITSKVIVSLYVLITLLACANVLAAGKAAGPAQSNSAGEEDWLVEAKQAEKASNFSRAAECYVNYLKAHPQAAGVHQRLGLVYYLSNRFADAIPELQRALKLDQTQWGAALFLGICRYRVGQFKQAVEPLRLALGFKRDLPEGHFWLGSTLLALGQTEEAISQLQLVTAGSDVSLEANSLLVKAYRDTAESYYRRIEKVNPDSFRTHQLQAESFVWRDREIEAIEEYRKALARQPNLEGVHRSIGDVYWQHQEIERARAEYETELRLFPLDDSSNLRLGQYWLIKGDVERAQNYLDSALRVNKDSSEAHRDLGQVWLARGDSAKAESLLKTAAQQSPDDIFTHRLLAQLYQRTGRLDLAKQESEIAQRLSSASGKETESGPKKGGKTEGP